MPNMFGWDQNHPSYNPDYVLGKNEAEEGDLLYTRESDGRVAVSSVTGESWYVSAEALPKSVRAKLSV